MKIKQLFHFVLACGLMLSTASCTDEVVTNNGDGTDSAEVPEGMQALTLKVGGISGGNVTKAGGIAKPEEIEVNDMTIYIFKYDPAKGADDTDDANYTLYDYWTYMKTAITGYTANSRDLHTFNLGGSGQFRTATIYVPKDAGKVKCLVTTGIGVPVTPNGGGAYVADTKASYMTLLSGHFVDAQNDAAPSISNYLYAPYSTTVKAWTLDELKKATWRELKLLNMPSKNNPYPSTISDDYWQTPLSMMGISAMMDLGIQTGNSSQIEATLKRHVSRLDIINGNSLDIRKIELINLPFSTNFTPAVDGIEASTQINLGTSKSTASGDDPADSYTLLKIYEEATAMANAITAYVYPNLPYNTTETAKNTPFIRVSIGDTPDTYILPLRTKNEDGSYTPVNLKSNHRYTLQLNKLGDNVLDYNIVIEDWQAGADFNVNLGQEVTAAMFNYTPAFSSIMDYNATNNQVITDAGKGKAYYYLTASTTPGENATVKWGFITDNTLYPTSESCNTNKLNILKSSTPDQLGQQLSPDYATGRMADNKAGHLLTLTAATNNTPQYSTCWYTLQNPFNTSKSLRLKAEQVIHPTSEQDKWAFEETLFAMAETNALTEGAGTYTVADFQADSYYTQWPDKGAAMTTSNVYSSIPDITPLLPPFDVTGTALDNSTGIDLAAGGFKKFTDNGIDYTIASNGDAETPCLILQTDLGMRMWERIKGDDGAYYIRILSVLPRYETFNSFEAMRSMIRNVENGHDSTYGYIVRYFPEGNYWKYNAGGNKRFSFASGTFGKLITDGTTGYIRLAHAVPTP